MPNAMIQAIRNRNKDAVIKLLSDDSFDPNQVDETGLTPLLEAVTAELDEFVKILLTTNNRVSPNIVTGKGTTSLMVAAMKNNVTIMTALLDHKPSADLYARRKDNVIVSALSRSEGYQLLSSLVSGLPAPSELNAALDYAAAGNKISALKLLLQKDEKKNPENLNHALLLAATYGRQEAVELLIEAGANVKHPSLLVCALDNAAKLPAQKHAEFVERLLVLGMDVSNWSYNREQSISLKILYIHKYMMGKTMQQLCAPIFSTYMSDMMEWMERKAVSAKENDMCSALVARISYARHSHGADKDEMDLLRSSQYLANVNDGKALDKVDKLLMLEYVANPPLWLRGSNFKKVRDNTYVGSDEKNSRSILDLTKMNLLIDKTLTYLKTRYKESGTKCLGYSSQDYVARRDIADNLTSAKIKYEKTGNVSNLTEMKDIIESALKRSEIKGRFFFSSHRFADELRGVLAELNTILMSNVAKTSLNR